MVKNDNYVVETLHSMKRQFRCCLNDDPTSETLAQHLENIRNVYS